MFYQAQFVKRQGKFYRYSGMDKGFLVFCEAYLMEITTEEFPPNE